MTFILIAWQCKSSIRQDYNNNDGDDDDEDDDDNDDDDDGTLPQNRGAPCPKMLRFAT